MPARTSDRFIVTDPVWVREGALRFAGHIAEKANRHCVVVSEDGGSYKVPWRSVFARRDGRRRRVETELQRAKSKFRVGDVVKFREKGAAVRGEIVRANPKRAVVVTSESDRWHVPYGILERVSSALGEEPEDVLARVMRTADQLISRHRLRGWSFQFDDAASRGGICRSDIRVISMSRQYCLKAAEAEWTDTLLHEVAHALVGPEHHHDSVWKRKAAEIGCTSDRCHSVTFSRPNWIVSCPRCSWARTCDRRRRNTVCRHCRCSVAYRPYSDALWEQTKRAVPD